MQFGLLFDVFGAMNVEIPPQLSEEKQTRCNYLILAFTVLYWAMFASGTEINTTLTQQQ